MTRKEKLKKQFDKKVQEIILPFFEQTKKEHEQHGVVCDIYQDDEPDNPDICIEFYKDLTIENGEYQFGKGETGVPLYIDFTLEQPYNIFKRRVWLSRAPGQPLRRFRLSQITKAFLSEWTATFIKGMKITASVKA